MSKNYDKYFSEIYAAASRHRFFDPSSGHLAVSEAAHLRCSLDDVRSAMLDPDIGMEELAKLRRLMNTLSNGYLGWLRQLGLTTAALATSLKRVSAGALQGFDQKRQETEPDATERLIFGD